jgi:nicotinic acid phosphoribosyltransferase
VHVGGSPVVTVVAPFGEALVIETLLLSILNHDAAIAAAAARMVSAARGRRLLEFGSRRTHEEAAVAAARAAYLVGFDATSNLEAGRRYGIPTAGTTGHAFILAHDTEEEAFRSQLATSGPDTTLLVDTFDTPSGIERALAAAGPTLGAVRIDSGDPLEGAAAARAQLDAAGATSTRIVVSGDLDEYALEPMRLWEIYYGNRFHNAASVDLANWFWRWLGPQRPEAFSRLERVTWANCNASGWTPTAERALCAWLEIETSARDTGPARKQSRVLTLKRRG